MFVIIIAVKVHDCAINAFQKCWQLANHMTLKFADKKLLPNVGVNFLAMLGPTVYVIRMLEEKGEEKDGAGKDFKPK